MNFLSTFLFLIEIAQATTFYNLAMGPAGAQITHFSATFKVPPLAASSGFHAIWPGLLIERGTFILQNVVDDQQGTPETGVWQFAPWYGPDGSPGLGYHQYANDISTVHPGDTVSSTFTLSSTTAQSATWVSSWSINGAGSNSVTSVLTQTNSQNPFSSAGLFIELQSGGQWDFGSIEWSDVSITIDTDDTSWCCKSGWSTKGYGSAPVASVPSDGVATAGQGSTTCSFDSIVFSAA